jgi:hypothetical protein
MGANVQRLGHIAGLFVPPRHLVATTCIRLLAAAACFEASCYLSGTLAQVSGFVSHVALFMAACGILSYWEASFVTHLLRAIDLLRPRLRPRAISLCAGLVQGLLAKSGK